MLEKIKTKIKELDRTTVILITSIMIMILVLIFIVLNFKYQLNKQVEEVKESMSIKTDLEIIQDKVKTYTEIKSDYIEVLNETKTLIDNTNKKISITENLLECNINQATRILKWETIKLDYCETQGLD